VRGGPEVADVFYRYGSVYRDVHAGHLSLGQRKVMGAIEACRSPALGGHVEQCGDCGHTRIAYNSCRNRHCPKCQGLARAEWLADRQADLLPVPYFHVVFTVPALIAEVAYQNKAVVYGILFKAAAETLRVIAADPKHLGAEIGMVAVLHTWGQALQHHPHLHCVIPGGGPSPDGTKWVGCRPGFFLPVRVLSTLYRRLFLTLLQAAFDEGRLEFFCELAALAKPAAFAALLKPLRKAPWVVYAKHPFGGPAKVLEYLGRYTHRVAIANSRLVDVTDGRVSFLWKDYRHHDKRKAMTLDADEFILSGDRVNPSGDDTRNPATLRSRERQYDGSIGHISAWQGWAETGDEDAGRGGSDAAASRLGLGHPADRGGDWMQSGDGSAVFGGGCPNPSSGSDPAQPAGGSCSLAG
jgi:hypothetical protein